MKKQFSLMMMAALALLTMGGTRDKNDPLPETKEVVNVYVVGLVQSATGPVATVWKNGVATALTDGARAAEAQSVHVSGGDVYVAGFERTPNSFAAILWKNGVATVLADRARAVSVFVTTLKK
jgi:hypothetical protein